MKHKSVCQKHGHLRKLEENLDDELYMKIPDGHKPLSKLVDDDFLDFITSIYIDEAKQCNSRKCTCANMRVK